MTGKSLLDTLRQSFLRVSPNERTIQLYDEIADSLASFTFIDSFTQLKKNEKGPGLALEILLFNSAFIHDVVISQTTVDHMTVCTDTVHSCDICSSYGTTINEQGESTTTDLLEFKIRQTGSSMLLIYKTEVKRFTEINRIKFNLLNLLRK